MDEQMLVDKAKNGDVASFEALVRKYQSRLYALAFRMVGNPEDAFDVSQDAILKVYKYIGSFHEKSAFSTWLYAITRNTALDFLRKRKKRFFSETKLCAYTEADFVRVYGETPEDSLEKKEKRRLLVSLIRDLPKPQRDVVILRDIDGYSYKEITEILGVSLGTVKSRLFRARETLRTLYTDGE